MQGFGHDLVWARHDLALLAPWPSITVIWLRGRVPQVNRSSVYRQPSPSSPESLSGGGPRGRARLPVLYVLVYVMPTPRLNGEQDLCHHDYPLLPFHRTSGIRHSDARGRFCHGDSRELSNFESADTGGCRCDRLQETICRWPSDGDHPLLTLSHQGWHRVCSPHS